MTITNLISHLKQLGNNEIDPINIDLGLCGEISKILSRDISLYLETKSVLHKYLNNNKPRITGSTVCMLASSSWSKFSGDCTYPISTCNSKDCETEYLDAVYTKTLWEGTDYSKLRREFCLHVAKWLEENL